MMPSEQPTGKDPTHRPRYTDEALQALTREIEHLRQDISGQLNQDVRWLQSEKSRLIQEIEDLRAQYHHWQSQRQEALSHEQLAQQQLWAKQFAQLLTSELKERLKANPAALAASSAKGDPYANLTHLDSTLSQTFHTLQQDLNSYQSNLSQQLSRMHSMESQGEVILQAFIHQTFQAIQEDLNSYQSTISQQLNRMQHLERQGEAIVQGLVEQLGGLPLKPSPAPSSPQKAPLSPSTPGASIPSTPPPAQQIRIGIFFALLSCLAFGLQNIITRTILFKSTVLGVWEVGGIISPSLGNSILILWLRMMVVVPLVGAIGTNIYQIGAQPFWQDLGQLFSGKKNRLWRNVLGSAFFLFVSQTLAYIAFGNLETGVVTTLILTYPIITIFLSRVFFGDRLTSFTIGMSLVVFLGVIIIAFPFGATINLSYTGVFTALGSGLTLAFCVIFTKLCFKDINPAPFTLIQFFLILIFSGLGSLFFWQIVPDIGFDGALLPHLLIAAILLGLTTLGSYLFQNFGIHWAGAALFSVIANTGPVLTSILAFLLIGEGLNWQEIGGICLITGGVVALAFKRLRES
ncbi:EamA family transporter [Spirulina subsalsa]|uniref:EamA family transporter n=1 Tax=Spirulina subsalsa TaxID=54311 RepID=UPI0009FD88C9|nr:EamA family transporter [Spirulina subsalsa]